MESLIRQKLADVCQQAGAESLYAVESGSRAWGFASPDSDYDIRFVYRHPLDWYLSVSQGRDVIEAMLDPDLDYAGWDLKKALMLLRKSNPSLLEWLNSPIVYQQDEAFMQDFRNLADECTCMTTCLHHYLNTAKSNWNSYFVSDSVRLKKYLYVLRPLFACRWIERSGSVPPVLFSDLVSSVGEPGGVADEVAEILAQKAVTSELGYVPRRDLLDTFIIHEIERISELQVQRKEPVAMERLNEFFRTHIH